MVALAAKARVIDDTVGSDLDKANVKHLASKGLEHLSEETSHGIVKRAPLLPSLKLIKKSGPFKPFLLKLLLLCAASTAGTCAAGK